MSKLTKIVSLSDSNFVCDSLHLADLFWKGRHDNAMRDLRKMQSAANTEGTILRCEEREFRTEEGNRYKKMDFTQENLAILCAYSEKFRPQFVKLLTAMREAEAKQIAQLKAENQKLLNSPERVETEFGVKYVKRIPPNKKTVPWYDVETGKRRYVLASSLSFKDLTDILIAQAEPKARGIIAASHALRAWSQAAKAAKCCGNPIPTLADFGVKTSFEENLMETLDQD